MAILGFIVAFIFSLAILLGGPIVFLAMNAFYGDRPWPALIPFAIGCVLMYLTLTHSPFHITVS